MCILPVRRSASSTTNFNRYFCEATMAFSFRDTCGPCVPYKQIPTERSHFSRYDFWSGMQSKDHLDPNMPVRGETSSCC